MRNGVADTSGKDESKIAVFVSYYNQENDNS